jgi:diadenosine tetraphosphate (Ap4A) HIT family hydrolase
MNPTMQKFGYPDTLLREYVHWCVLLRPQQATLGALVLAYKGVAQALGDVGAEGCAELARVSDDIEKALTSAFGYDKINYLMLMMLDPDVHFHVLPRYAAAQRFSDTEFVDPGWPGPPQLGYATPTDPAFNTQIMEHLRDRWPSGGD